MKPRGPSTPPQRAPPAATGRGQSRTGHRPDDGAPNPLPAEPPSGTWPADPLGARREPSRPQQRPVRAPADRRGRPGRPVPDPATARPVPPRTRRVRAGTTRLGLLLAERARAGARCRPVVALPSRLSVSAAGGPAARPGALARSTAPPAPAPPAPLARRGTASTPGWSSGGGGRLLDVDELPGAADDTAAPDAAQALQEAFLASAWCPGSGGGRVPLRDGRRRAVMRGRWTRSSPTTTALTRRRLEDRHRTGRGRAAAAAVQLAVYRLAWHHLSGVPLHRIRAAFHYVGHNRTVRPADLLDHADGLPRPAVARASPVAVGADAAPSAGARRPVRADLSRAVRFCATNPTAGETARPAIDDAGDDPASPRLLSLINCRPHDEIASGRAGRPGRVRRAPRARTATRSAWPRRRTSPASYATTPRR